MGWMQELSDNGLNVAEVFTFQFEQGPSPLDRIPRRVPDEVIGVFIEDPLSASVIRTLL